MNKKPRHKLPFVPRPEVFKIGVKFHDNDFYNCFHAVLQTIRIGQEWTKEEMSREQWCIIINEISYGIYLLFQNRFTYSEEGRKTKEYIMINVESLLLGDEVDEYLLAAENATVREDIYILYGSEIITV